MQKRATRKYLADRGLTAVLKPGGRQYTPKHSKVLTEAIAAGIEPLGFGRKVKRVMRCNLVVHDPDALFNIIVNQRRDQAVLEANDASRRQTAARRDARSVAAAGATLQGIVADEHDASQSFKTVKAEQKRRYDNNKRFICGKVTSKPGRPLRLPPLRLELVGARPPHKRWLRQPNLLRPRRLRRMVTTTCTFACHGRRWCQ